MYREYYVDGPTMKQVDTYAIERMGIPSLVLMERAAYEVAQVIMERFTLQDGEVVVLAGTGNNGADGLVAARILVDHGYNVKVIYAGNPEKATAEWKTQQRILINMKIPMLSYSGTNDQETISDLINSKDTALFVDGLFGIGLSRDISGAFLALVQSVNATGKPIIAIDIPSGVLSSSGLIAGDALRCTCTVTFGRKKLGCVLYPGAAYCGELICKDVGFTQFALDQAGYQAVGYGAFDKISLQAGLMKKRPEEGHKGTFGKLLVIAGCETMAGAAVFSAKAAMNMGTGLVKVFTPTCNRDVILNHVPEAILSLYDSKKLLVDLLEKELSWADSVVFGPGIGQEDYVYTLLEYTLRFSVNHKDLCVVLDADGLRCLAAHEDLWDLVTERVILTPHIGEMAALTGCQVKDIQKNQLATCHKLAQEKGCICIMKQATPIICGPRKDTYIVTSGCNALGTAGSGDVLAGMVGALCGEGYSPLEAASLGAYIHGLAGTICGNEKGNRSVCASDLYNGIAQVMKLLDETGR